MSEGDLVKAVIAYLNARGGFAWRNQSGQILLGSGATSRVVRMGRKGMPDVLAVISPLGRLVAVECKRGKAKPTADQTRVMGELKKRGALVIVARSIVDVEKALA